MNPASVCAAEKHIKDTSKPGLSWLSWGTFNCKGATVAGHVDLFVACRRGMCDYF